jgi:hypothetical protein
LLTNKSNPAPADKGNAMNLQINRYGNTKYEVQDINELDAKKVSKAVFYDLESAVNFIYQIESEV